MTPGTVPNRAPRGTVFYEAPDGRLQVQQISWSSECAWKMPVRAWHDLMEHHYPGIAWLALSRDNFERLVENKTNYDPDNFFARNQNILPRVSGANAAKHLG